MINETEIQKALTEYAEKTQNINIHKRMAFYDGILWAIQKIQSTELSSNFTEKDKEEER